MRAPSAANTLPPPTAPVVFPLQARGGAGVSVVVVDYVPRGMRAYPRAGAGAAIVDVDDNGNEDEDYHDDHDVSSP